MLGARYTGVVARSMALATSVTMSDASGDFADAAFELRIDGVWKAADTDARAHIHLPRDSADKRLYAIRDVTATVESTPLITASILSKKLAAGLGALVLDVKTGTGAFAAEMPMAVELAESLVAVANGAGLATSALLTDMNEPLASAAGNAVEVRNAIDFLTGAHRDPRLERITLALTAEMLVLFRPTKL